jgi:hypothetical protein
LQRKVEKKRSWLAILDHSVWTKESSNSNLRQGIWRCFWLVNMSFLFGILKH